MKVYFNEYDRQPAAWLRQLQADGHLADGPVDVRSIEDVQADDVRRFDRVHFFAGIGGWEYALQLAGWHDDRPVWTGSCPCQPFSAAGKRKGQYDERHLWPEMFRLIRECRPPTIFGEQVSAAIRLGWLDGVFADLESEGYACGAVVLGAHSVGAPHIRQRIFWVADAGHKSERRTTVARETEKRRSFGVVAGHGEHFGLADHQEQRCGQGHSDIGRGDCGIRAQGRGGGPADICEHQRMADADGRITSNGELQRGGQHGRIPEGCGLGWLGNADGAGSQGWGIGRECAGKRPLGAAGAWDDYDLIPCQDGKARRIESGVLPLAHGVSGRVGLIRGYGNAIVPQVAAAFVRAFLEAESAVNT